VQDDAYMVYAAVQGSVYGFDLLTGKRKSDWENIHDSLVTSVVFLPTQNHVLTGSDDMTAKVHYQFQ
jgi:WD40 repeat protein